MRDLPGPGIEPVSPAMAGGFFTTEPLGKPRNCVSSSEICHDFERKQSISTVLGKLGRTILYLLKWKKLAIEALKWQLCEWNKNGISCFFPLKYLFLML